MSQTTHFSKAFTVTVLYSLFAAIATTANIGAQMIASAVYSGPLDVYLDLVAGTGVGLIIKYYLDKHYIFGFKVRDLVHDGLTFVSYASTGVATTAIFWGMEILFNFAFANHKMRFLGGLLGLIIGYFVKFQLDKRVVFRAYHVD